jgi:RNA polymerase sigma-70 factor (ECF subfamily)
MSVVLGESTVTLLQRIRAGDLGAREHLMRRYLPLLRRWAHGRLPSYARELDDTDDLVQITLLRSLKHLDHFEAERPGAFLAYLRQTLLNEIRDQLRSHVRRPAHEAIEDSLPDADMPTPLEQIGGLDQLRTYERVLGQVPQRQRELLIMRLEFGLSYADIAAETGGTAGAARIMVMRALQSMARGVLDD